ncbi:ATP-binding response regulator [Blautia sp.]
MKDKKRFVCANAFYEGREYYYCLKKIPSYNWTMLFLVSADHVATNTMDMVNPIIRTFELVAACAFTILCSGFFVWCRSRRTRAMYEFELRTNERLSEVNQELEKAKKAAEEAFHIAEEANQSKSRFLSNMSHDMRTPMNAIVGFTTLLDNESKNPEKVQEYTKKIAFSSQHLLGLINDVLDMSKIEAGKMKLTLEEENMDEIIENIDALVRPQMVLRRQKFEIIVELLKMEGAECTVCENGQLAVETFTASEENTINLILMDVQMPVMNGYEATKAIRSSGHPMAETIPIIAMTANAFVEDIHDALDAGMDAHVAKPVDMKVLKETVAQVIGGRS